MLMALTSSGAMTEPLLTKAGYDILYTNLGCLETPLLGQICCPIFGLKISLIIPILSRSKANLDGLTLARL